MGTRTSRKGYWALELFLHWPHFVDVSYSHKKSVLDKENLPKGAGYYPLMGFWTWIKNKSASYHGNGLQISGAVQNAYSEHLQDKERLRILRSLPVASILRPWQVTCHHWAGHGPGHKPGLPI